MILEDVQDPDPMKGLIVEVVQDLIHQNVIAIQDLDRRKGTNMIQIIL